MFRPMSQRPAQSDETLTGVACAPVEFPAPPLDIRCLTRSQVSETLRAMTKAYRLGLVDAVRPKKLMLWDVFVYCVLHDNEQLNLLNAVSRLLVAKEQHASRIEHQQQLAGDRARRRPGRAR